MRRLKRRHLESLGLVTPHRSRTVPTVGGMILFGLGRLERFPDARIQAGRFAGTDKATILDHARFDGYPVQAVGDAVSFVEKHSLRGAVVGRVRRRGRWSLPPEAVREAIVNAVVHAYYSQRGGPIRVPFGLTLEDLPHGVSKVRNRVLGRVFRELRLVEQWGSGAQTMIAACREAGLPAPVWEEIGLRLRVTLRRERVGPERIDARDRTILDLLDVDHGRPTREIAAAIGLPTRSTRTRLARLVERGLVREVRTGPNDPRRRSLRVRKTAHSPI